MNMRDKPREITSEDRFLNLGIILCFFSLAAMVYWALLPSTTIDWRGPIQLQLENDTFFHYENGTLGEEFNGTEHDLVPGDLLILGPVSFTHFHTLSSTECYSTYPESYSGSDSYSYEDDYECYTSYWDELTFDAAGINFTVSGNHGFMKTCFNAFCKVNATVNGDEYGLGYSSERLTITVQEFTWVRWCQGEGVCQ